MRDEIPFTITSMPTICSQFTKHDKIWMGRSATFKSSSSVPLGLAWDNPSPPYVIRQCKCEWTSDPDCLRDGVGLRQRWGDLLGR